MKLPTGSKVMLIGAGDIGMAYTYPLVSQGTVNHLVIINIDEKKTTGNVMDLNHDVVWAPSHTEVIQGTCADCDDAVLVVICADAAQKPDEIRLQLVDKNMEITKSIVNSVMASGFDGLLLIATNPVNVLTYAARKYSGLPYNCVSGSNTILDTAHLRYMLGEYYDVSPMSVHAYIIDEHDDSKLPVSSSVNIVGVNLSRRLVADLMPHNGLEDTLIRTHDAAYEIVDAKGSTSYGTGMGLTRIMRAIFQNQEVALPVSAYLQDEYGHEDVLIGTPAIVNRRGIRRVIEPESDEYETKQLNRPVQTLRDVQDPFWKQLLVMRAYISLTCALGRLIWE